MPILYWVASQTSFRREPTMDRRKFLHQAKRTGLGGEKLTINAANGTIDDNPRAMKLFKSEYRKPWIILETV